jgi:opacity protein-like surface antigen
MWLRLVLSAAAAIGVAQAQTWEVAPFASYLRLSKKPVGSTLNASPKTEDTTLRGKQPAYGARLTLNTGNYYALEFSAMRSKAEVTSRVLPDEGDAVVQTGTANVNQYFINGVAHLMPRGEWWRPYLTVGFQLSDWGRPSLPDWPFPRKSRHYGFNYGAGIKFQFTKRALVRFDFRDIISGSPYDLRATEDPRDPLTSVGRFRQLEGTIGIGVVF